VRGDHGAPHLFGLGLAGCGELISEAFDEIVGQGVMIHRMREKPDGENVHVVIGDMNHVDIGRKYGLVYLMYKTIVNLLTQDDQILCFENAVRHLTDDGAFVLECRVPPPPKRSGCHCVDAERLAADRVTLEVGRAHEPGRAE
jgi:hypothetical protein